MIKSAWTVQKPWSTLVSHLHKYKSRWRWPQLIPSSHSIHHWWNPRLFQSHKQRESFSGDFFHARNSGGFTEVLNYQVAYGASMLQSIRSLYALIQKNSSFAFNVIVTPPAKEFEAFCLAVTDAPSIKSADGTILVSLSLLMHNIG